MIVDSHVHLVYDPDAAYGWQTAPGREAIRGTHTVEDLLAACAPVGVDAAIVIEPGVRALEPTLAELAKAAVRPAIAGVVGWVDLHSDPTSTIATYRAAAGGEHLCGVRDHVQRYDDAQLLSRPLAVEALRKVAAAGVPFDLVARTEQIGAALDVLDAVPDLTIVISHLGRPPWDTDRASWKSWTGILTDLGDTGRTAVKVSAVPPEVWSTHRARADEVLALVAASFGPARTMLGSNWPLCLVHGSYTEVWDAGLGAVGPASEHDLSMITGEAAQTVYGLAPQVPSTPPIHDAGPANEPRRDARTLP